MKKILTHLTGIVFLITILAAGACNNGKKPMGLTIEENDLTTAVIIKNPKKVKIYLKAIVIDGEKHLQMYDSNDPDNALVVVDSLYTWILPGMKVIWKLDSDSGIEKINKIGSTQGVRNIFKKDAKKRFLSKAFVLKLSDDISGPKEEYDIEFEAEDGKTWTIDPYLKLPPPN